MGQTDPRDIMPDGRARERKANAKALWQCSAAFLVLLTLTIIAHLRPDWIATSLLMLTSFSFLLVGIGLQEIWASRRGRPPF